MLSPGSPKGVSENGPLSPPQTLITALFVIMAGAGFSGPLNDPPFGANSVSDFGLLLGSFSRADRSVRHPLERARGHDLFSARQCAVVNIYLLGFQSLNKRFVCLAPGAGRQRPESGKIEPPNFSVIPFINRFMSTPFWFIVGGTATGPPGAGRQRLEPGKHRASKFIAILLYIV